MRMFAQAKTLVAASSSKDGTVFLAVVFEAAVVTLCFPEENNAATFGNRCRFDFGGKILQVAGTSRGDVAVLTECPPDVESFTVENVVPPTNLEIRAGLKTTGEDDEP